MAGSAYFDFLVRPLKPHGRNQGDHRDHPARYTESARSRPRTNESEFDAPVDGKGKASEDVYEEDEDEEVVNSEPFFEIEAPRFRGILVIRQKLLAHFLGGAQKDVGGARAFVQCRGIMR